MKLRIAFICFILLGELMATNKRPPYPLYHKKQGKERIHAPLPPSPQMVGKDTPKVSNTRIAKPVVPADTPMSPRHILFHSDKAFIDFMTKRKRGRNLIFN